MRLTPQQVEEIRDMNKQLRLEDSPPQLDVSGVERLCVCCKAPLHPSMSREYSGTVGGFCDKLCRKDYERKLMVGGMSMSEASDEIEKYEEWKPKRHLSVVGG